MKKFLYTIAYLLILTFYPLAGEEPKTLDSAWTSKEPGECSINLKLFTDKTWEASCCGPGSCINGSGSYTDGAHTFQFKVDQSMRTNPVKKDDLFHKLFKKPCEWTEDKSRLDFSEFFSCGKPKLFKDSSRVLEGAEVESEKYGILIALGLKSGSTSDDAKFRSAPSTKAKTNQCKIEFGPDQYSSEGVIPKNIQIYLLAKTKEKVKVDKWENHWYLIQSATSPGDKNCKENTGWVFGQFVKEGN